MNICFIAPSTDHSYRDPHIAITVLATYINEKSNHKATILDYTFHLKNWKKHLYKKITEKKPDVIGITCTKMYMHLVLEIIKEINENYNLPIILGGYYPSIMADEAISIKGVDAICIGDAEETIIEYLDALEKGKSFQEIKGLWYKKNGKIYKNKKRCFYQNISNLPHPNWDLWDDIKKYLHLNKYIPILKHRGCYGKCTFCSAHSIIKHVPGKYVRYCSPKEYVDEIKYQYMKYKFKYVVTHDANFIVSDKWVEEFSKEYIKAGLKHLPFSIETRPDTVTRSVVRDLKKAGCRVIRIGIESGSDYIRNTIFKKNMSRKQIYNAVKACKEEGVTVIGYFIIGCPGESKKTMLESYEMAKELDMDVTSFATYKPVPGTEAYDKLIELGGKVHEEQWSRGFNILVGYLVDTPYLKAKEVKDFHKKVLREFRIIFLIKQLKKDNLKFFYNFPIYALKAIKLGVKPSWLPFGWVTQLENF